MRQDADDDRDAAQVPPGTDVGEQLDQVDAERVEQPVREQDDGKDQERPDGGHLETPDEVGDGRPGQCRAVVDRRGDGDLTQEVEPPDIPGPDRLVPACQPPRPEVQTARSRVDRADLPHRQCDAQDEEPDHRPAAPRLRRSEGDRVPRSVMTDSRRQTSPASMASAQGSPQEDPTRSSCYTRRVSQPWVSAARPYWTSSSDLRIEAVTGPTPPSTS